MLTSDLIVDSPTVSESAPTAGASFTLSATVRNQGNGRSDSTTLRYYRSSDSTITTADTEVGTDSVSGLNASESGDESIGLTAPSERGTYYYGACVDEVAGESDGSNNCSAAVTVMVGDAPSPDLVIDTPSLNTSTPDVGASFTFSVTVRNQGDGSSDPTTLRYLYSTDSTITSDDAQVGMDSVPGLNALSSSDKSISLIAPSTPGFHHYGACVDAVAGESDTGNNCVRVFINASPAPDLVVLSATVSNSAPAAGASFTLSAGVWNQGNGRSDSTTLRYYRSTDATITTSDTSVGTDVVSGLAHLQIIYESISLTAPTTPGTYYYGACVEAVSDESDTNNNCSPAVTVTVGAAPPDLIVSTFTVRNSSPVTGQSFIMNVTVNNQGNGISSSTTLRYFRSTDATITTSDAIVPASSTNPGSFSVDALSPSGSVDKSASTKAPSTPGTYYYGACVGTVTGESDTTNNCSPAVTVTVGAAPAPDLIVSTFTVRNSSPVTGQYFTMDVTVNNQGIGSSESTTLRYFRSTDATITTSDASISLGGVPGFLSVDGLSPSGSVDKSASTPAPSTPGTYYYGACVGTVTGESDTTNNCSPAATVTVQAASPDLVVDTPTVKVIFPSSRLTAGFPFTLSFTVRNQGNWSSGPITLRYYRSTDAEFDDDDTLVGTQRTDTELSSDGEISFTSERIIAHEFFAPSSTSSIKYPYITDGTYYYLVCVEPVQGEPDTTNNCSSGVAVTATTLTASSTCIVRYVLTPLDKCAHKVQGKFDVIYGEVDAFNSGLGFIYYDFGHLKTITRSVSGSGPGNRQTTVHIINWADENWLVRSVLTSAGNERIIELRQWDD